VERNKKAPKAKEKAEAILRETMDSTNLADKYAAAQCLASDGICEYKIILTLLQNYFSSNERITREQMTKLLSNLSRKSVNIKKRELSTKKFKIFYLKVFGEFNGRRIFE
jgi:hypothetical protein